MNMQKGLWVTVLIISIIIGGLPVGLAETSKERVSSPSSLIPQYPQGLDTLPVAQLQEQLKDFVQKLNKELSSSFIRFELKDQKVFVVMNKGDQEGTRKYILENGTCRAQSGKQWPVANVYRAARYYQKLDQTYQALTRTHQSERVKFVVSFDQVSLPDKESFSMGRIYASFLQANGRMIQCPVNEQGQLVINGKKYDLLFITDGGPDKLQIAYNADRISSAEDYNVMRRYMRQTLRYDRSLQQSFAGGFVSQEIPTKDGQTQKAIFALHVQPWLGLTVEPTREARQLMYKGDDFLSDFFSWCGSAIGKGFMWLVNRIAGLWQSDDPYKSQPQNIATASPNP